VVRPGARPTRRRRGSAEAGSATVWVLALAAVLGLLAVAVGLIAGVSAARNRAAAAADLAALAAARRLQTDPGDACRSAAAVAVANGASLVACRSPDGVVVDVAVETGAALPGWLPRLGAARVSARAGPTPAR